MTRTRAAQDVLHYVLSFSVATRSLDGGKRSCWATEPFIGDELERMSTPIGALVILTSAPTSPQQIGWLREVRYTDRCPEYLIESLDGSSSCWWTNVGIKYMDTEVTDRHPEWQWSDEQRAFSDEWTRVCFEDCGADWHRPFQPVFGDGFRVTIGLRTKFSEGDNVRTERTFDDWRKLTKETLRACYEDCLAEREAPDVERQRLKNEDAALAAAWALEPKL